MRMVRTILQKTRALARRVRERFRRRVRSGFDAATIDLASPEVALDPFPYYERLRAAGSVHFLARHNFCIVLGYAEVESAFAQPNALSNSPYTEVDGVLLGEDPPRHAEVRRLLSREFSAATLQRLGEKAEGMAAKLLRDRLDVVSDYAAPLSRAVASEFLGFDDDAVVAILTAYGASLRTASPLTEFIVTLDRIADRSAIYSRLMNDGDRVVSDAEVRSLVRLLWLAATMTTERTITRAVLRLLQHDDVRRAVSADLALLPALAEEVLRLHPPEHTVPRMTTQPLQLGGVTLPAGALVQLCVSAANRDPARFEDPAALRLDRPAARHFTFGSGVHRCIGAPLARNVVGIALKTLLQHMPAFRAEQPLESIQYFATPAALTPLHLVIRK